MKWTKASEDNLPRPEDMPKCGRFLGPNGIYYYGTIQMVAEIISAARGIPLVKNRAMYTEWLDESDTVAEGGKIDVLKKLDDRLESLERYLFQNFSDCHLANAASKANSVVYLLKNDLHALFSLPPKPDESRLYNALDKVTDWVDKDEYFRRIPIEIWNECLAALKLYESNKTK